MLIVWLLHIKQKKRNVKCQQTLCRFRDIHPNYKHVCHLYLLVEYAQMEKRLTSHQAV